MICLCVTTYKKNEALRGWLQSIENFGSVSTVLIADDNNGEAQPITEEFQAAHERGEFPFQLHYATGPRSGIAKNKNRCIKFFLEQTSDPYLVLSDDDITFKQAEWGEPYIADLLIKATSTRGLKHCTGYLGGSFGKIAPDGSVSQIADPFFTQFVPLGETEYLYFCRGSQGILLFFVRDLIERVGYMDSDFDGFYGMEHSAFSARCNRLDGRNPELFAILKASPNYFGCQGIPNQYLADPQTNAAQYVKKITETYAGIRLSRKS